MTSRPLLAGTTALVVALCAQAGFAQTTLIGVRAIDDQINDINRSAQIDLGPQQR